MSLKSDIISAIQAVADAVSNKNYHVALGTPGNHVKLQTGETEETGQAWNEPGTWPIVVEGISNSLGQHVAPTSVEYTNNHTLLSSEHFVLLSSAGTLQLTIPSATEAFKGYYTVKNKAGLGSMIYGTIDGVLGSIPMGAWECIYLFCDGNAWYRC